MGCDIHLSLEYRHPTFGWVGIDTFRGFNSEGYRMPPALNRNYRLFAALAGVRGEGPDPRGVPDDVSPLTKIQFEHWDGDGHSHSWLPLADAAREFNKRRWEAEKAPDPESYRDKFPASFWFAVDDDNIDSYRLIFWFDN